MHTHKEIIKTYQQVLSPGFNIFYFFIAEYRKINFSISFSFYYFLSFERLYGFFEKAEKEIFLNLISVSGIGASTARMMLSYMKPEELTRLIVLNDIHGLEKIKGIGKKTAERLVLELKDKLAKQPFDLNISPLKYNTLHTDALNALMALGIARSTADQALQRVTQTNPSLTSLEEVIKKALKTL